MSISRFASRIFLAVAIAAISSAAVAQNYPDKPIRLVVPFPAGGVTDLVSRLLGKELSDSLGQPVMIDNRPGASGMIGAGMAANAAPDGYTLLMGNISTLAVNPVAFKNLPYNAETSFAPISMVAKQPIVMATSSKSNLKTIAAVHALAASKPGGINFGTGGASFELAFEAIKDSTGIKSTNVRYQGDNKSLTALLGGEVDLILGSLSTLGPHIQSGAIHAIAVASEARSPALAEVPTLKELGVPVEATSWQALVAPAGTPEAVIAKLSTVVQHALSQPAIEKQYELQGVTASPSTAEQLHKFMKTEITYWRGVGKKSGFDAQ